jgi:hypothetical protein
MTLVLFRRRALSEQSGRNRGLGRAFEKAVRRKPLARRTRALCEIECSEEEVLKLAGVGTEAEEAARDGEAAGIDG